MGKGRAGPGGQDLVLNLATGSGVGVTGGNQGPDGNVFLKKLCNPKIMLFLFTYSLFTISFSSFLLRAGDDLGPLTLANWPLRENTGHVQWTGWDVIPLLLGGN